MELIPDWTKAGHRCCICATLKSVKYMDNLGLPRCNIHILTEPDPEKIETYRDLLKYLEKLNRILELSDMPLPEHLRVQEII
jgi:hypothetical protein